MVNCYRAKPKFEKPSKNGCNNMFRKFIFAKSKNIYFLTFFQIYKFRFFKCFADFNS